jgi:hypothetical protein
MRFHLILSTLLCAALTLACSGGGGTSNPVVPTGNLTIRFGSDSLPGYGQAVVSLEKVEGSTDGSNWVGLGNVKATYDLMALQNGHSVVILPSTAVTPTTYTQFRITWATVNYQSAINQPAYVVPTGGTGQVLSMPVTTVVNGPVTVPSSGSATALIMLTGHQLVQSRVGGVYAFQAVGRALDLSASATITGHAGDGTTPLSGVEVYAETVDGSGLATIQRRALTDASGNFELDGLSTGFLYFVTAQPAGSLTSYAAVAASPVNATGTATYTANLPFSTPQTPGSMTITITPASLSTQGTWGELRQTLTTGTSGSQVLIVRSEPVATGSTQDQVGFAGLAPGTYGVTVQRSTALAAPVMKTGTQVLVSAGGTATTGLTIP